MSGKEAPVIMNNVVIYQTQTYIKMWVSETSYDISYERADDTAWINRNKNNRAVIK